MELLKIESRLVAQAQEPGARGAYVPPAGLETYDRPTASEALRVEWRG
jgi:hypothetical protein